MRYAIADPPYLGRGRRWYGDGRGAGGGRGKAPAHSSADQWDDPAAHIALVAQLVDGFDGWAIAAAADSLPTYLSVVPADCRVLIWSKGNAPGSGARVRNTWEAVLVYIPPERRGHGTGHALPDVLTAGVVKQGLIGAKPEQWTRWVLAVLGVRNGDDLVDLFPGSGAVTREAAQLQLEPQGW